MKARTFPKPPVYKTLHESKFFGSLGVWLRLVRTVATLVLTLFFQIVIPFAAFAVTVTPPTFSTGTGTYTMPQTVSISGPTGSSLFYSVDGTPPTTPYTAPLSISTSTQVNAVAVQGGVYSAVATAFLDVDPGVAPILPVDPSSGLTIKPIIRLRADFGLLTGTGTPAPVFSWVDLSGNGNSATSSYLIQPMLLHSLGVSAVNFNGSKQFLSLPTGFSSIAGNTVFAVVNPSSLTANATIVEFGQGSTTSSVAFRVYTSGSYASYWTYNTAGTSSSSVTSSALPLVANQYQLIDSYQSAVTAKMFFNGALCQTNTSMIAPPNTSRTANFIGRASNGTNYFAGNIAELLVYSTALSDSQREAIEAFLLQKYQLLSITPDQPIISVPGGALLQPTQVVISRQPGTVTHITTDGSTPTSSSPVYCGLPLMINYSQTVKALCIKNGVSSGVASASYTLDSTQFPAPSPTDTTPPSFNPLQLPVPSM